MPSKYTSKGRNEIDIKRNQTSIIAKLKTKCAPIKMRFLKKRKL